MADRGPHWVGAPHQSLGEEYIHAWFPAGSLWPNPGDPTGGPRASWTYWLVAWALWCGCGVVRTPVGPGTPSALQKQNWHRPGRCFPNFSGDVPLGNLKME